LRALTDEPAEQAVQNAIVVSEETLQEAEKADTSQKPPITISELPPESKTQEPVEKQSSREIQSL
jgi:hypothetical protein